MSLPKHIAIICDGNRRWAKAKGLPEFSGHQRAVDWAMEKIIDRCLGLKIPYLTFWVFSTENWRRGQVWVEKYFQLLRLLFSKNLAKLNQKNVRLNLIGDLAKLPPDVQKLLNEWVKKTKNNKKLTLTIAINYGGRDEILRAVAKYGVNFSDHLDTAGLPDPDLLIRTAPNNRRLSGFLLWQIAYTQLCFTDTLFPDFDAKELDKAIAWWQTQTQNLGR
jgi:undecaprenyl diphosphate synthase